MMRRGFTLIELTVVVAIIIALTAIIVPNLSGNISRSNDAAHEANAKQAYSAALQAAAESSKTPGKLTAEKDDDEEAIQKIIGGDYEIKISASKPDGELGDKVIYIQLDSSGQPVAAYFETSESKYPKAKIE